MRDSKEPQPGDTFNVPVAALIGPANMCWSGRNLGLQRQMDQKREAERDGLKGREKMEKGSSKVSSLFSFPTVRTS